MPLLIIFIIVNLISEDGEKELVILKLRVWLMVKHLLFYLKMIQAYLVLFFLFIQNMLTIFKMN